jgi:hypothetical protein
MIPSCGPRDLPKEILPPPINFALNDLGLRLTGTNYWTDTGGDAVNGWGFKELKIESFEAQYGF